MDALIKYRWTILGMVAGTLPFVGLLLFAHLQQERSPADLALADGCVDWAHKTAEARAADGPDIAAQCDRYFRVRSDSDADEDDQRWEARNKPGGSVAR
jgi:hypothetical protein